MELRRPALSRDKRSVLSEKLSNCNFLNYSLTVLICLCRAAFCSINLRFIISYQTAFGILTFKTKSLPSFFIEIEFRMVRSSAFRFSCIRTIFIIIPSTEIIVLVFLSDAESDFINAENSCASCNKDIVTFSAPKSLRYRKNPVLLIASTVRLAISTICSSPSARTKLDLSASKFPSLSKTPFNSTANDFVRSVLSFSNYHLENQPNRSKVFCLSEYCSDRKREKRQALKLNRIRGKFVLSLFSFACFRVAVFRLRRAV